MFTYLFKPNRRKSRRSTPLTRKDIFFDDEMIENYIRFTEKWYFKMEPFQKFLAAFVFLFYKKDRTIFFDQFFYFMGRGGGKNGLISSLVHFFISPLHGIDRYNISIVANSELQAKTSFKEIYETIGSHDILKKLLYRTKLLIGLKRNKFRTTIPYLERSHERWTQRRRGHL